MKTMLRTWAASAAIAALTSGTALADDGLRLPAGATDVAGWQARFGLTTPALPAAAEFPTQRTWALPSAQLLGDYYFTGPGFGSGRVTGGLRATSGLLIGARAPGLAAAGGGLTLRRAELAESSTATLPYLGVGYTGLSARGGWGFSADLGLLGTPRSPGLRWQQQRGGASLDEVLRDLKLTPTVQLGVSYSF